MFDEIPNDEHPHVDPGALAFMQAVVAVGICEVVEAFPKAMSLVSAYLDPRTYQAALVDLNFSRTPDPDPYPFWHQAQITDGQNYAGWDDRQASEYLEQARTQVDITERTKRYRNFQVRFANKLPALPLFYPVYTYAVDKEMQGVQMGPLFEPSDRLNSILNWFLIAESGTNPTITPPTP